MTRREINPSPVPAVGEALALGSERGRWVLLACILGSGLAGIDATVVSIALPAIGEDFDAGFSSLQWTIIAYTLTLASLILIGGSLGDRFGRRRVFQIGIAWFAFASLLCALAPGAGWLIAARALQGVGGALLTPASLAIIEATFRSQDRARAIGAWSAWSGAASALAPFVGGWLIALGSWRWIFVINPPLAILVIWIVRRHMPETRNTNAKGRIDITGALLGALGLGGLTWGIIAAADHGGGSVSVLAPVIVGVAALAAFYLVERRTAEPMLPLSLFGSRQFSSGNGVTFLVYAAIAGSLFLLVVELQVVSDFSPLLAGTALMPITLLMLALAARFGALSQRIGPRGPMSVGPVVAAIGLTLTIRLSADSSYISDVLPAVSIFGLGLAIFVAPLTSTVLGAVSSQHAGVASGVNNAVARAAGLVAIAALPVVAGLSGSSYTDPVAFLDAFRIAIWICVGLMASGGILAALTIRNPKPEQAVEVARFCSLAAPPSQSGVR